MPGQTYGQFLAISALAINAISLVLLAALFFKRENFSREIINFFGGYAFVFTFLIALGATVGSLIYSEVLRFPPCPLCWYQRIFMYPLVIIAAVAWWKKQDATNYIIPLASIGGMFSLYHYLLEWGLVSSTFCSAQAVSCAQRLVFEFGFVSLPWMTLSAFAFIILLMVARKTRGT